MVRTPDVDQRICSLRLLEVIGQIGAEIGPAAIALLDRTVLIIAELGRAEQRQFDRLPILGRLAFGRFKVPVIDQILRPQPGLGLGRLARSLKLGLGRKQVMLDPEQGQIGLDLLQHGGNGAGPELRQPFGFISLGVPIAEFGSQRLTHRDQIVARIEPFRDRADRLAQRLAVTQVDRAGEHIDLPAGIVDVIFADHLVPGPFEQAGQCIADHRAAAVAHVHRPGRIGRDIFDVDRAASACGRTAIVTGQRGYGL